MRGCIDKQYEAHGVGPISKVLDIDITLRREPQRHAMPALSAARYSQIERVSRVALQACGAPIRFGNNRHEKERLGRVAPLRNSCAYTVGAA